MAFQKYLEQKMPVKKLKWDKKRELTEEEKKEQKIQLQSATTNALKDINESIVHILDFTKQLQNETNLDKSKIVLRENCNTINYFCQCMERLLLFGFKKKMFRPNIWSFIDESTSKCFDNCAQLESDINLVKSIDILNDIGRLRAFLR
eukprot:22136_1